MNNEIRNQMLPQIMLLVGPTKSGKTSLGSEVAFRTNIKLINFNEFVREKGLRGKDDETKVLELINSLYYEVAPRVMFEDFPQNTFQAKFFKRNCKAPSNCFVLDCGKDYCQQRIENFREGDKNYINSG